MSLYDLYSLLHFLRIVFVVGVDVGVNTAAPRILMERCGLDSIHVEYEPGVYFALGAFPGAIIG